MNDLIWIGNTLYPRWFVFAVPAIAIIGGIVIAFGLEYLLREK